MAAPTPVKLGPGTLVLTSGDDEVVGDMSCLIQNAVVSWEADAEDDISVLCGDVIPGARTYTATLSGTVVEDLTEPTGVVAYTWANKGTSVGFTFVPNSAAGAEVTGNIIVDPIDVGGDEYGQVMTADIEWSCVGEPVLDWPDAPAPPMTTKKTTTTPKTTEPASS